MKKVLGIFLLLVLIAVVTTLVNPKFLQTFNLTNLVQRTALFGIISIGVAFVIITGGIDLSIGSVISLTGCILSLLLAASYSEPVAQLNVLSTDIGRRTMVIQDDGVPPRPGDRLLYKPPHSAEKRLNALKVTAQEGSLLVELQEEPAGLRAGDVVKLSRIQRLSRSVPLAVAIVLLVSIGIGLIHGLLITKLKLQPFVVTLCGLLIYRGAARWLTGDRSQGFGDSLYDGLRYMTKGEPFSVPLPFTKWISEGNWSRYQWNWDRGERVLDAAGDPLPLDFIDWMPIPMAAIILLVVAVVAAVFLNYSIWGRYLLALGRNEQAARYSGINTDRMIILAYVICSFLAGVAGILFAIDLNSFLPSGHANFYELYAIAAAVLGGCSLRGGEGSILGVVIGAALMRLLRNSIFLVGIADQLEFAVIGLVILAGVIVDELVKRFAARRRARQEAVQTESAAADKPP